jgi:hypothetical protein
MPETKIIAFTVIIISVNMFFYFFLSYCQPMKSSRFNRLIVYIKYKYDVQTNKIFFYS